MRTMFILLLFALVGCGKTPMSEEEKMQTETAEARMWRWRREAEDEVKKVCTNEIVGFRRVIQVSSSTSSDAFNAWSAEAKAEFINATGGIEVTNFPVLFLANSGKISAYPNRAKIIEAERAAFEAHLKQIKEQ